jgi:toxin YoeB
MRTVTFHSAAFRDYTELAARDPKLFERLTRLISETLRDPFGGIGKPEPLKRELAGWWSRRINDEHRLVYKVTDASLIILSCRYHYRHATHRDTPNNPTTFSGMSCPPKKTVGQALRLPLFATWQPKRLPHKSSSRFALTLSAVMPADLFAAGELLFAMNADTCQ